MNLPFLKHRASTVEMLAALGCLPVLTVARALSEQLKDHDAYPTVLYAPTIMADSFGVAGFADTLHARRVGPWSFRIQEWPAWRHQ